MTRKQMVDVIVRQLAMAGDPGARQEVEQMSDDQLQSISEAVLSTVHPDMRAALTENPDAVTDFARRSATAAGGASRALAGGLSQTGEAIGGGMGRAGEALGNIPVEGPINNIYNIALRAGLDDEGARVARVIAQHIEGGMGGAVGDLNRSPVGAHGPFQFYGPGGQLDNFAREKGLSLQAAGQYARDNPAIAADWALRGYLGRAIREGQARGLHGEELATYAQEHGQVSVSPQRAGLAFGQFGAETSGPALPGALPAEGGPPREGSDLGGPPGRTPLTLADYLRRHDEARLAYLTEPDNKLARLAYLDALDNAKLAARRDFLAGTLGAKDTVDDLKENFTATEDFASDWRALKGRPMSEHERETLDLAKKNYLLAVASEDRAARNETRRILADLMLATGDVPEALGGGRTIAARQLDETIRANEESMLRLRENQRGYFTNEAGQLQPTFEREKFDIGREDTERARIAEMAQNFASHAMTLYGDLATRRAQAERDALAAAPYYIPPGMEYAPGDEPGGLRARSYAALGLSFNPLTEAQRMPWNDPRVAYNEERQRLLEQLATYPGNPAGNPISNYFGNQ